jgi:hypothetical protein
VRDQNETKNKDQAGYMWFNAFARHAKTHVQNCGPQRPYWPKGNGAHALLHTWTLGWESVRTSDTAGTICGSDDDSWSGAQCDKAPSISTPPCFVRHCCPGKWIVFKSTPRQRQNATITRIRKHVNSKDQAKCVKDQAKCDNTKDQAKKESGTMRQYS